MKNEGENIILERTFEFALKIVDLYKMMIKQNEFVIFYIRPSLLKSIGSRHQPIVTFFKIVRTLYRISFHSELSSRSSDTTPSPLRGATPP
jgi:hypothetical protein